MHTFTLEYDDDIDDDNDDDDDDNVKINLKMNIGESDDEGVLMLLVKASFYLLNTLLNGLHAVL